MPLPSLSCWVRSKRLGRGNELLQQRWKLTDRSLCGMWVSLLLPRRLYNSCCSPYVTLLCWRLKNTYYAYKEFRMPTFTLNMLTYRLYKNFLSVTLHGFSSSHKARGLENVNYKYSALDVCIRLLIHLHFFGNFFWMFKPPSMEREKLS